MSKLSSREQSAVPPPLFQISEKQADHIARLSRSISSRYPASQHRAKNPRMIRPVLTEFALFLAPFAIYALYLWGTRANVIHPESWPLPTLAWLTAAALALMAGSFIVLAQWGGEPAGSHYVPAHIENGRLVPGTTE
jgi:hypothetical protein